MCLTSSERLRSARDRLTLALHGIQALLVAYVLEDPAWLAFWFS
jgi:hypothetical protein